MVRRQPSRRATLQLAAALGLAVACAKRGPVIAPEPAPPAPSPADPDEGRVDVQFLLDAKFAASQLGPDEQLWTPAPTAELQPPSYPERPLRAGAPPSTVVVRIVIGTEGRVTTVADSPKMASTPGPFLADFRQAVEEAVRAWSFTPGRLATFVDGRDMDGDGKIDYRKATEFRTIPVYYDVRFDFEIVDGTGRVRLGDLPPLPR
jgi:hypothetical protein